MATRDEYNDVNWHAALDAFITRSPRMESVQTRDEEDADERDWDDVVAALRDFAVTRGYGWGAACRALGEAMNPQRGMFSG